MTNTNITTINGTVANANNIGELKGLLAAAREQGLTTAIIRIPVRLFAIDSTYQTEARTKRNLNYLISDFRREKLLPVTGVPHDEEGLIYLVDGYGRWQASQIVDKNRGTHEFEMLECMVILNAPTEPKARRRYEAEQYAFQNKNVAKVTALQKHGALMEIGDNGALLVEEMKKKYKLTLTDVPGIKTPGCIPYAELYSICKACGKDCAEYILDVCAESGLRMKTYGYSSYVLRGLRDIWRYHPEQKAKTKEWLSAWFKEKTPEVFKAKAVSRYPLADFRSACSVYLEDLLVDNIDLKRTRTIEGKTVNKVVA